MSRHLERLEVFVSSHTDNLTEIEELLQDYLDSSRQGGQHKAWTVDYSVATLDFHLTEKKSLVSLSSTPNILFNKVMTVFTTLCCEIDDLRREVRYASYSLRLLGHSICVSVYPP